MKILTWKLSDVGTIISLIPATVLKSTVSLAGLSYALLGN